MKNRSKSFINNTTGDQIAKKQLYMNMFSTNKNPSTINIINTQQEQKQQKQKNHVFKNKNNLKNFFRGRFPKQDYNIKSKSNMIPATKILQLKKQQSSRQDFTKITLNKSVQISNFPKTPPTKKMIQIFSYKSKQVGKKLIKENDRYRRVGTSLTTYLTPTSNSIIKRSQTAKKQAYVSVFGDKTTQLKQKILQITCGNSFYTSKRQNIISIPKAKPKTNSGSQKITKQQKQKLGTLLQKLQAIALQINPHRFDFFKSKSAKKEQFYLIDNKISGTKKTQETEVFQNIKSVSQNYRRKNQDIGMKHLKTVEDIQIIDPKFYQQMVSHKNSRLLIRNKLVYGNQTGRYQKSGQSMEGSFEFQPLRKLKQNKQANDSLEAMMTITERLNGTIQNQEQIQTVTTASRPKTKRQIIIKFSRTLIQVTYKAVLYGIKFQNIFEALLKTRKPYQLQGSYALFKLIKSGDLQKIKDFINKSIQYAYQIDYEGRTLLIYAAQNNQPEIIRFLIKVGVNIDMIANNGNSALFCAIKRNNYKIIQSLLRAGASPWSTKHYNINQLIKDSEKKIQIVIKNARKIHIGLRLYHRPQQRKNFWFKNRQACIQGQQLINF